MKRRERCTDNLHANPTPSNTSLPSIFVKLHKTNYCASCPEQNKSTEKKKTCVVNTLSTTWEELLLSNISKKFQKIWYAPSVMSLSRIPSFIPPARTLVRVETRAFVERLNNLAVKCMSCEKPRKRSEAHCSSCNEHILQSLYEEHFGKCSSGTSNFLFLKLRDVCCSSQCDRMSEDQRRWKHWASIEKTWRY